MRSGLWVVRGDRCLVRGIGDRGLSDEGRSLCVNKDIMSAKQHMQKIMIQTLDALFDGVTLVPEVPLNIKSGTRVRITVESLLPETKTNKQSFLQTAKSLNLQGKPDWSDNIDQYLYGESVSGNA